MSGDGKDCCSINFFADTNDSEILQVGGYSIDMIW